ncbi:MAG: hypothetical protein COA57_05980 [Flavobacteriales bacterium]|nr:MAG: hypothetical protein COA57_05980 [Flavobacteriales bacterium]
MKKTSLSLLLCLSSFFSTFSQSIPNGDFENWTTYGTVNQYDEPDGWGTINSVVSSLATPVTKAMGANAYNGTYAMKLETVNVFPNNVLTGIATNGTLNSASMSISGGVPFGLKPDSITGYYKYIPATGDAATVAVLFKNMGDTVGFAVFNTNQMVSNYTQFSVPITYINANTPDSMLIIVVAGDTSISVSGSALYIDALDFVYGTNPCSFMIDSLVVEDVRCNGGNKGTASVLLGGGIGPFTDSWSGGTSVANANTATGLSAGTYTVTFTDVMGCATDTTFTVSEPPALTANINVSDVSCYDACDGVISGTITGGTPPYLVNNQIDTIVGELCGGNYLIIIRDANNCFFNNVITVNEPPKIDINISSGDASCAAASGGALASASNGVSPYSYQWSSGSMSATADSLKAGLYMVSVEDANGCKNFDVVLISDGDGPIITVDSAVDVSCYGADDGFMSISVSGGAPPYEYKWSNKETSEDIDSLWGGPYVVNVTDTNGCKANAGAIIDEPNLMEVSFNVTKTNCGISIGAATVTTSGGTLPYSENWSTGQTGNLVTGLASGVYTVTVTDNRGCVIVEDVAVADDEGPEVAIDSIVSVICGGTGSVYVNIVGQAPPYTYLWSNGMTTEDIAGIATGGHSVVVTDTNGCIGVTAAFVPPMAPQIPEICMVTVDTATGKNLCVFKKDSNLIGGLSYANFYVESTVFNHFFKIGSKPINQLSQWFDQGADINQKSWQYRLSLVDTCGTESELSGGHKTIHLVTLAEPSGGVNVVWDHYNGFGFGMYKILRRTDSTGWILIDSLPVTMNNYLDMAVNINTPGLAYLIEIETPGTCSAFKAAENYNSSRSNVAQKSGSETQLSATATSTDASFGNCDGTATVNASGGISPYTYQWDANANNQTTETAINLCPNTYSVTVTDNYNNSVVATAIVGQAAGMDESFNNEQILVYPNPSKGIFELKVKNTELRINKIEVYNMLGEMISQEFAPVIIGKNSKLEIDLSAEPKGIYFLKLESDNGVAYKKLVLE